jgi:hypothetical protein
MQINATFAFAAGATQTDINQFESAVNTVIGFYDSVFKNINVTLNVAFGYGESFSNTNNNQIVWQVMPNAGPGGFTLGRSQTPYNSYGYTTQPSGTIFLRRTTIFSKRRTLPCRQVPHSGMTLYGFRPPSRRP